MISALRDRIELQSAVATPDGEGGESLAWQTYATVWAAVEPLSKPERMNGARLEAGFACRITIRHRSDVTADHRVRFDGRDLNINSVTDPDGFARWLSLDCAENVGG